MNTQQALDFVMTAINDAKTAMIANGYVTAELIFGTCKKLAAMLDLPFDLVVLAFEKA